MATSLTSELQKLRKMLSSSISSPIKEISSPVLPPSEQDSPITIPDNSFIKRWRSGDKIFDRYYTPSGSSTPQTPSSPIRPLVETPATVKKRHHYDYSDSDDFLNSSKHEISRYRYDYTEIKEIGSGSFGRVYKSRNNLDRLDYAVKKIHIKNNSECAKERAIQEALTLAQSSYLDDNSYIIKYYTAYIERSCLYLIMELCDCSLPEYIERTEYIDEKTLKKIFRDVIKGLAKLHRHKIVHLDIKPENILFSFNHKFKIADLGLARITTNLCGEIPEGDSRYLAPELMRIMSNEPDTIPDLTKADVFSLGCTMLEIMNAKPLPNNGPLWHDIRNGAYEIKGEYSYKIKAVVRKMLEKNPVNRPSAEEILNKYLLSDNKIKLKSAEQKIAYLENLLREKNNEILEGPRKIRKFSI